MTKAATIDRGWAVGLLLAALVLYWINLGKLPLRDWDEATVAQVAREIWRSPSDALTWLHPTIAGVPYFNKPPLIHWLIALCYRVGGVNEWTTRLPGATLTALSVPLLYGIGRELFARKTPAIFAALIYLTLLPVARHGRLAMLDGAVLCFFLLLIFCLLRTRRDLRWGLGVGLACGLLGMTKGIIVIPLATIALIFTVLDTPRLLSSGYVWLGVLIGSFPLLVWYVAQWRFYGQTFIRISLFNQSLDRTWQPVENNQGAPWYYLLEILKYSLPWLLFWPQGFRLAWDTRYLSWAKLVFVWVIGFLLVISVMSTKLPWYVLPVYPALALVGGMQLTQVWNPRDLYGIHKPDLKFPGFWWISLGLIAIAGWGGCAYFSLLGPDPKPELAIVLAALSLTTSAATVLAARHDAQFIPLLIWGMYVSLILFMASNYWIWELGESYPVKPVAAIVQHRVPPQQPVFTSYPYARPSLNFYSDRQVIPQSASELQRHWREDSQPYLLVEPATLTQLNLPGVKLLGKTPNWLVITKNSK